jgi:small GTP-binding protein
MMLIKPGVGKTSLVNQYVRGQFEVNTVATIGAAFMKKDVVVNGWNIMLQIWDTAGQERFRSMAPMYYRGAHAAILVFDVSQPDTLDKVEGWISELQGHASEDILIVVYTQLFALLLLLLLVRRARIP